MISLSVVIPVYNEEDNIRACIIEVEEFLKSRSIDYEIIIVDDGSTDATPKNIKTICANDPLIVPIHNDTHAYGLSLKRGINASTKDYILFFPSDMQYDIEDLQLFLEHITEYDFLLGYREKIAEPFPKAIVQLIANFCPKLVLGSHVRDVYCDFKLFRRSILEDLSLSAPSVGVQAELLYNLLKKKYSYTEIPVHHYPRKYGRSKGFAPSCLLGMIRDVIRIKLHLFA